jgi:hypothetical protein
MFGIEHFLFKILDLSKSECIILEILWVLKDFYVDGIGKDKSAFFL